MKRYLIAYGVWLGAVLVAATGALYWYKYVEEIGLSELARRLHEQPENYR